MSLIRPNKRALQVGKIVEILNGEGESLGKAKLIQRRPSRYKQDGLGYVRMQRKHNNLDEDDTPPEGQQKPTLYIWASERWEVEWVSHKYYRPGDRNCTEVHYYVCTTTDYPSFVDINNYGNKGASQDGLYIFLEEEGVLSIDGHTYLQSALKGLQRVYKAIPGDIVIYTHNPIQVKERWELNKLPYRILDFLSTDYSFSQAITRYMKQIGEDNIEDYIILSGDSWVQGDRVKQTNPEAGLLLKDK